MGKAVPFPFDTSLRQCFGRSSFNGFVLAFSGGGGGGAPAEAAAATAEEDPQKHKCVARADHVCRDLLGHSAGRSAEEGSAELLGRSAGCLEARRTSHTQTLACLGNKMKTRCARKCFSLTLAMAESFGFVLPGKGCTHYHCNLAIVKPFLWQRCGKGFAVGKLTRTNSK